MFLTRAELIELAGTTRPKVIARWLARLGIGYIVGVDGWPRVMRSVVEGKMGATQQTAEPRLRLA
jgi:hypothetical protein